MVTMYVDNQTLLCRITPTKNIGQKHRIRMKYAYHRPLETNNVVVHGQWKVIVSLIHRPILVVFQKCHQDAQQMGAKAHKITYGTWSPIHKAPEIRVRVLYQTTNSRVNNATTRDMLNAG